MTPTTLDYALFAGAAYDDRRDFDNRIPIPDGASAVAGPLASRSLGSGFEVRTYEYEGKIVVSFAGTYFPNQFLDGYQLSQDGQDSLQDWAANIDMGNGGVHSQLRDAARYYADIKQAFPGREVVFTGHSLGGGLAALMGVFFDKEAITFDPAPFRMAATELNASLLQSYLADLHYPFDVDLAGFRATQEPIAVAHPELLVLLATLNPALALALGSLPFPVNIPRESRVTAIAVAGEFLTGSDFNDLRNQLRIYGSHELVANGSVGRIAGGDAHSISLLWLLGKSEQFRALTGERPDLLGLIFDRKLYAYSTDLRSRNFSEDLLRKELGATGGVITSSSTGFLDKFISDVRKLAGPDGMVGQQSVQKALTVAAMEYYYFKDPVTATALFTTDGNGIHFKFSDIGETYSKALPRLVGAVNAYLSREELDALHAITDPTQINVDRGTGHLMVQDAWHIQTGNAGMVWTASAAADDAAIGGAQTDVFDGGVGDDILIGGAGQDFLTGGTGADILIGGVGVDWLDGGIGNDKLLGGQGADIYRFTTGWGHDTIEDSDGQGVIDVEGIGPITGAGASKVAEGVWQTADRRVNYTLVATDGTRNDLYITFSDRPDVITIRNWSHEQNVGIISLPTTVTPQTSANTLIGDIAKETHDDGDVYNTNSQGYVSAGAQADAADILLGTTEGDSIQGLGGNDGLVGGDGNDLIDGGDGSDLIFGGADADTLNGGSGNDFIYGSAVGSINRPVNVNFTPPEVNDGNVEAGRGFSWVVGRADVPRVQGDNASLRYVSLVGANATPTWYRPDGVLVVEASGNLIDGGAGDDYIAAGTHHDTVHGGADNDDIIGMRGNDLLFGDAGDDIILGDGSSNLNVNAPEHEYSEYHGNDVLVGGTGNDSMKGQGGADELYGGADNDLLFGDDTDPEETLNSAHGNDYLDGGDGNDRLSGGGRDDTLVGAAGADFLWGDGSTREGVTCSYHGLDELHGGAGNDQLHGGGNDDILEGGADNDSLWGDDDNNDTIAAAFHGKDYLDGGDGNDYLEGGGGDDELFGGSGNDSVMGDGDPSRGATVVGRDYIDGEAGNDRVFGGGDHDTIFGGVGNDSLFGDFGDEAGATGTLQGNDYLDGEEGNDEVVGNGGADTLYGSAGDDTLWGDGTDSEVEADSDGADVLDGGEGNDVLGGQGGNDTIAGGEGNDSMNGGSGEDQLDGGNGNDTLFGQADDDSLAGGDGNDYLDGGAGNDVLDGGEGSDGLYGGAGNDTLISNGLDYLDGGAGDDTYVITLQPPRLVGGTLTYFVPMVNDFQGANTIIVNGATVEASSLRIYSQGGVTYLSFGGGGGIAMGPGVDLSTLQIQDSTGAVHTLRSLPGVDQNSGRVGTAVWSSETGFRDTQTLLVAQTIRGSGVAEDVRGGSGDDRLDAGGGDDLVEGNAGDDQLIGGDGSDTLVGGAGSDTFYAGRADGTDTSLDVYRFNLGDGSDWIEVMPTDGAPRDLIQFGEGISYEDIRLSNLLQDTSDTGVQLVIEYGVDDQITLSAGGEGSISGIRFADGSFVSMVTLLNQLPSRTVDPSDLGGTNSDDVLIGTSDSDRLNGARGNDTLEGGAGRDLLIGGGGTNTYRFDALSGNDMISPTAGEVGLLVFAGIEIGTATARFDDDDLVISHGNGNSVRIADYARSSQLGSTWQVQFGAQEPVSLGQFLQDFPAAQGNSLQERREQFLDQQLWQLSSTAQRFRPQGYEGPLGVVPNFVEQATQLVEEGQPYEFSNYLQANETVVTVVRRESTPIYRGAPAYGGFAGGGNGAGTYVPVLGLDYGPGGYAQLPAGAVPVYGNGGGGGTGGGSGSGIGGGGLIGYLMPSGSGSPTTSPGLQLVGWEHVTRTYDVITPNDTVVQTRLTGTSSADVVVPGVQESPYPVLFRGSVETGGGDDFIYLGSGQNGEYPGPLYRSQDWQRLLPTGTYWHSISEFLNRGRGAWIDAGSGNDVVTGTDGNDFIIGGTGSDLLDGQAGADTYHIGVDGNDLDRIADLAGFDWASSDMSFIVYGGDLNHPNLDTVEFDASVSREQLSYRWKLVSSEGVDFVTLELFHEGQAFLQIDYRASMLNGAGAPLIADEYLLSSLTQVSGLSESAIQQRELSAAGVEQFRFSDGTVLKVGELLSELNRMPDDASTVPPVLQGPLPDISANEDESFATWPSEMFRDAQGQPLSFAAELASGVPLPEWMDFDTETGELRGTPGNDQVGIWEVVVTATNAAGQTTTDSFNVTVANVNDAPQLISPPQEAAVVEEGATYVRTIDWFQDVDVGDSLTLSVTTTDGGPLPAWVQFDAPTRSLSAVPPFGALGLTTVRITATDTSGASVASDFVIDVHAGSVAGEVLQGGSGNDTLRGGSGDDTLRGESGEDELDGGAGADHLFAGAESSNTFLFGRGDGQDRVHFDGSTAGGTHTLQFKVGVNPGDVVLRRVEDTDLGDSLGALEVSIAGTTDTISFSGFFFNDSPQNEFNTLHQIRFADGTTWDLDAIIERVFSGSAGNDTLFGLRGADVIDGGGGDDVLWGRAGTDTLRGGSGDDTLRGESGDDTLDGGAGADHLFVGWESNNTVLFGRGDGQDRVHFDGSTAGSTNTLQFKAGVNPGEVVLRRVEDTDLGDSLGALEVSIAGTTDTISFNGFFFNDSPQNEFNTLHQIRFADGTTWDLDAIVERVFSGSAGNDTLFGLRGADVIDGGGGDDVLWGRAGTDTLRGGSGDDTLRGESGDDTLDGGAGADHLFVGWESNNTVLFGRGDGQDRVHFDGSTAGSTNTLQFKAGVNPGEVVLRRVEDTDLGDSLGALEVSIAGTTDTISFNAFFFNGGPQNEFNTLHQIGFADGTTWDLSAIMERVFTGTDGDDVLIGLPGSDTLDGGAGDDTLDGGAGADVYRFARGHGQDTVLENDATAGVRDSVQFAAGIVQADLTYTRLGDNLEAAINGTADKLIFQNWYLGDQHHVEDFRFDDGSVLTDTQVQGLVSAMAGFSAPAAAATSFGPPVSRGTPSMNLTPNALM